MNQQNESPGNSKPQQKPAGEFAHKGEQTGKGQQSGRDEQASRSEQAGKGQQFSGGQPSSKGEQSGRSEQSGKGQQSGRSEYSSKGDQSGQNQQTGKSEQSAKSEESGKSELAGKECKPCDKETAPLKGEAVQKLRSQLKPDWKVVNEHHLEKQYKFKDFREALNFTNRVGELAEKEQHHPDITLGWGRVGLTLCTHNIDGLSENDFILAAKADQALSLAS